MTRLSPWLRRACALGLLAGLVGAVWVFAVLPIGARIAGYDNAIAQSRELLVRSQRTAAERPRLRAERDALEAGLATGSGFLEGDSLELIAAALQDRIKRVVERHGGSLDSLQTLPSQVQEDFRRVAVRVTLSVGTPALQRILHTLEAAQPVLLLDSLEISRATLGTSRKAREADALTVRFDVLGFVRGAPS